MKLKTTTKLLPLSIIQKKFYMGKVNTRYYSYFVYLKERFDKCERIILLSSCRLSSSSKGNLEIIKVAELGERKLLKKQLIIIYSVIYSDVHRKKIEKELEKVI